MGVCVQLKSEAFLKVGELDELNLHKRSREETNRSGFLRSRVGFCRSGSGRPKNDNAIHW